MRDVIKVSLTSHCGRHSPTLPSTIHQLTQFSFLPVLALAMVPTKPIGLAPFSHIIPPLVAPVVTGKGSTSLCLKQKGWGLRLETCQSVMSMSSSVYTVRALQFDSAVHCGHDWSLIDINVLRICVSFCKSLHCAQF